MILNYSSKFELGGFTMETTNQRTALVFGILLISVGALVLAGQIFDVFNWNASWPLINVAIGALFFVGMFMGGKSTAPLAIPGAVFTGVGLILFFQNLTGAWETWSYAWGLVVASVGAGLYIYGARSDQEGPKEAGRTVSTIGLILFLVFGMIFEVVFSVFGISAGNGTIFFPLALAAVGLYLFVSRAYRLATHPDGVKRDDRDLFWPVLFIGIGLLWTMVILGRLPMSELVGLLSLWPVLLIAIGVDLATGRRYPWVGAFLGMLVVAGMFFLSFYGNQIGWKARLPVYFSGISLTNGQFITERVQGSGDMVSEPREVQGFDRVRFDAFGEMEIVQGEQEGLVIEAQPNLLTYITTEVRGDQLVIGIKPHISVTPLPTIRYQLSVKDLRDLEVSGAGLVRMGGLNTERLTINSSGAAGISISGLQASALDANLSGTGRITVGGGVDTLQVNVSGAGGFDGAELSSKDANIELTGIGGATVWVTDSLDALVSGVGSIQYYGNPSITKQVSGIGNVKSRGDK
jgi:hypothetical protein